jgi:hypothetical protein
MTVRGLLHRALLLLLATGAFAAEAEAPPTSSAPNDSEVRELRQRLDALGREIDLLAAASDTAASREQMQKSWQALQDYMGWMHGKWGTGPPWMMGPDVLLEGTGWLSCPALGGSGESWPMPGGITPRQYGQQMGEHMQQWKEQLDQLAQTGDSDRRMRLVQEHWHEIYRDMQSLRGLGWMWGGPMKGRDALGPGLSSAKSGNGSGALPDAGSPGAKLVSEYCTQCHVAPAPILHTKDEWAGVVGRMHANSERRVRAGIRVPSDVQIEAIFAYMQQHAR